MTPGRDRPEEGWADGLGGPVRPGMYGSVVQTLDDDRDAGGDDEQSEDHYRAAEDRVGIGLGDQGGDLGRRPA